MTRVVRGDGGSGVGSQSLDEILEVLSNYQRRAILRHLSDAPGNVHAIDGVIAHLGDLERERHGVAPGVDHLLSVLVHVHGPKLDAAGLVDYDLTSREIRYHPDETVERILAQIESAGETLEGR